MATRTEGVRTETQTLEASGVTKFFRDVVSVFELRFFILMRAWWWYIMGTLVFPVAMFYFARSLAPDSEEAVRRAMTGAIVFGATMMTTNMLAQNVIQDRFRGRLKLIITMPVFKSAYVAGVLLFGGMLSASTVGMLLAIAYGAGVDFSLNWAFLPVVVTVLLSVAGMTLLIVSYAPNAEVGNLISNLFGILLTLVSPVFFPAEQAPALFRALGWVSPFRYAADAMMKILSGRTDVWLELAILGGFAVAAMAVGLWRFRWRER